MNNKYAFLFLASTLCFSSLVAEYQSNLSPSTEQNILNDFLEHPKNVKKFLRNLANAEKELNAIFLEDGTAIFPQSIIAALNKLQPFLLQSQDLEMIQLFHRAVRNFNSLSEQKANPVTTYYKHYQAPAFFIPKIDLTFDVAEAHVAVTTKLVINRNGTSGELILDGRGQDVQSVKIDNKLLDPRHYYVTKHELIILDVPEADHFEVEILSTIDPFHNQSLEGMYLCHNWLTTQCESEGARRIFFTLDRPDVLSCITTTIIADKNKYPYRLSNGNLVSEDIREDGYAVITWHDPFPKPSYLFACVLGDFSLLNTQFKTKSGLEVELQVYVEPGKESRAEYSLYALKKAMEFDEIFFDREYDLSCLKMVGIPDFNSGAMENKGLMIFNETALLVDAQSGTDGAYRTVAKVVAHEYFHNWSGNRVTVRNWFEIALKEAFTDWRANRFGEWMFGEEFVRPKDVSTLKEFQFPEEYSEHGHPLMVESYVDAHSIYDSTTYVKGREVFRTFEIYVNSLIPDGFREVLNLYFAENDGKAVTFKELLLAADSVLARVGKDSSQFERWFHQPGTPLVEVKMNYLPAERRVHFQVKQSCKHPRTGQLQKPFIIPFSIELLGEDGVVVTKQYHILDQEEMVFSFAVDEQPTPIFMHGLSAPVNLKYAYTFADLRRIMLYTDDAVSRWEAAQNYATQIIKNIFEVLSQQKDGSARNEEELLSHDFEVYREILKNDSLTPLSKVQLLQIPSLRALSQAFNEYDFALLNRAKSLFRKKMATISCAELEENLKNNESNKNYQPSADQMQIRELRNACLGLLTYVDEKYVQQLEDQYFHSKNFNDKLMGFVASIDSKHFAKICQDFYETWKNDKAVFNYWVSAQASSAKCTVDDLLKLESVEGYEKTNPNHIRSLVRTFIGNLGCYHDSEGLGYRYIVDKILEVEKFNPILAHNYIAESAFQDFEYLPEKQKNLMTQELKRLKEENCSPQTKDLVQRILKNYSRSVI